MSAMWSVCGSWVVWFLLQHVYTLHRENTYTPHGRSVIYTSVIIQRRQNKARISHNNNDNIKGPVVAYGEGGVRVGGGGGGLLVRKQERVGAQFITSTKKGDGKSFSHAEGGGGGGNKVVLTWSAKI